VGRALVLRDVKANLVVDFVNHSEPKLASARGSWKMIAKKLRSTL